MEVYKQSLVEWEETLKFLTEGGTLLIPEDALIQQVVSRKLTASIDSSKAYESREDRKFGLLRRRDGYFEEIIAMHAIVDNDPFLQALSAYITKGCQTKEEMAQALLCFVQTGIGYMALTDEKYPEPFYFEDRKEGKLNRLGMSKDGVKNPYKTLLDKEGDCKDKSVLYISLLSQINIPSILVSYDRKPGEIGHVNVGVPGNFNGNAGIRFNAVPYYIAETTVQAPAKIDYMLSSLQKDFAEGKLTVQDPFYYSKAKNKASGTQ